MFTVYAKDFMYGTVFEKNVSVERVNALFVNWSIGMDIKVENTIIENKGIETISIRETNRSGLVME